jgi:hypothetical protein
MRIHSQDEFTPGMVPSVQLLGVGKVGVASDGHAAGHLAHQLHRPIDPLHAAGMAGGVTRAINQVKHLLGIGQAHD